MALFAQLGGGIYTKAADVGADLVGKVEAGIPEDDPRNAAVVADLVGDNVGDCAGRGADLFESMSAENIGAMILGVAIYTVTGNIEWIMFPLVLRSFGVFATMIGLISVPFFTKEDGQQDPMTPLNYGFYVVSILSVVGLAIATKVLLGDDWYWFFFCGIVGILTGIAFVYITQYYTAGSLAPGAGDRPGVSHRSRDQHHHRHRRRLRDDGPDRLAIGTALVASFLLGSNADVAGVPAFTTGIFGTAVATMGMLMSAAYILAMDTFGPITDNAGGITEFSGAPESARHITDALDAVGNTTKALTKGYAVASAGLAAFLLFSAYLDKVKERLDLPLTAELPIDLANVDVFVGALLGVMLVFLFSSLAIRSVGSAAGAIIEEVRRQFREDPGIMAGTSRPDYARAVDITARAALKAMVAPGHPGGRYAGGRRVSSSATACSAAAKSASQRQTTLRLAGGRRPADRRHHRRHHRRDLPQQRRRRLGQRQEVHRGGRAEGRERRRPGQGLGDPRRRRRRRHGRRPVQGHGGPLAARPGQAPGDDHAGARAAVYDVERVWVTKLGGVKPPFLGPSESGVNLGCPPAEYA